MPSASQVALLRDNIDRRPHRIKEVLTNDSIRRHIFNGIPNNEKKAVDAFAKLNQRDALKTRPKVGVDFLDQTQSQATRYFPILPITTVYYHHRCSPFFLSENMLAIAKASKRIRPIAWRMGCRGRVSYDLG